MTIRLLGEADLKVALTMANHPPNRDALASNDLQIMAEDLPKLLLATKPGTESCAFSWSEMDAVMTLNDISYINRSAVFGLLAISPDLSPVSGFRAALQGSKALFEHAFNGIGLNRVECRVIDGNRLTPLMCKKYRCKVDGVMRQAVWRRGEFKDITVYSMLADDFRGKTNGG